MELSEFGFAVLVKTGEKKKKDSMRMAMILEKTK